MRTSLALCAVLLAAGVPGALRPASLTVSAAISLTEVLQEIGALYTASGGGPVTFNFGGSNALARQIVNGASVDVFVSADNAQMDVVERAGLALAGSRVALLGNRLAIAVPAERAGPATAAALAAADVRRVAVGDPEAVPAGVYARQYLQAAGLWDALQPKLVPSRNVRAALTAVENGAADAAIVYVTDARQSRGLRIAAVIDGAHAPAIVYPACIVRSTRQGDAARRFLAFLMTGPATQAFERHGFRPLTAAR